MIKKIEFQTYIQDVNQEDKTFTGRVFTSDENSIELNFKVLDITDFSNLTAKVIICTSDRKVFTNDATFKQPNSFSYIISPDERKNSGEYIAQLLVIDGETVLTSPKLYFEIEGAINEVKEHGSDVANEWKPIKEDIEEIKNEIRANLESWGNEIEKVVQSIKEKELNHDSFNVIAIPKDDLEKLF